MIYLCLYLFAGLIVQPYLYKALKVEVGLADLLYVIVTAIGWPVLAVVWLILRR